MNNWPPIQAVIFDLDGVIIDSNTEIEVFWKGWAAKEGIVLDKQAIEKYILGRTTTETVEALFPHASEKTVHAILEAAKVFDTAMRPKLLPGVYRFIEQLFTARIPIGLVTSSPKVRAGLMLELHGLASFFGELVTGEDVTHGKPDPEPYLTMAARLRVPAATCLVFEDSDSGIESALAAGMQVIAIGNSRFRKTVGVMADYTSLLITDRAIEATDKQLPILLFA